MAQSPYPIRLPGNLRSLLEIEAAKHQQSLASYIVGACWAQLERHGGDGTVVVDGRDRADDLFAPADPGSAADVAAASEASRIARHLPKVIPAISNRLTFEETVAFVGLPKAAEVSICGGVLETPIGTFAADERVAPGELRIGSYDGPVLMDGIGCPHEEWAPDGEKYRCRLAAGHKSKCVPGERVEA